MSTLRTVIFLSLISFSASFAGIPDYTEQTAFLYGLQDSTEIPFDKPAAVEKPDNYRYPGRAMIFSGLVPGLGEYYTGNWKRSAVFAGIEIATWSVWAMYNKKADDQTVDYELYADDHWEFARWVADFYKWEYADTTFRNLFTNAAGAYEDIWASSHNVAFYYTDFDAEGQPVHISNSSTKDVFWDDLFGPLTLEDDPYQEITDRIETDPAFQVIKDHTFYENIGKYNHFYAGWDDTWDPDNPDLDMADYMHNNEGYWVARSPNKLIYRNMRGKANDYSDVASSAVSFIMLNHVASMIDAVFTTRAWNNQHAVDLSLRPTFNPENSLGVGGVEVSVRW